MMRRASRAIATALIAGALASLGFGAHAHTTSTAYLEVDTSAEACCSRAFRGLHKGEHALLVSGWFIFSTRPDCGS